MVKTCNRWRMRNSFSNSCVQSSNIIAWKTSQSLQVSSWQTQNEAKILQLCWIKQSQYILDDNTVWSVVSSVYGIIVYHSDHTTSTWHYEKYTSATNYQTTRTTREQWIQRITFSAETNAGCNHGSACRACTQHCGQTRTHTHTEWHNTFSAH